MTSPLFQPSPPRAAVRLLARRLPLDQRDMIVGDLTEVFLDRVEAGRRWNRLWFWLQALGFAMGFAMASARHLSAEPPRRLLMSRLATSCHQATRRLAYEWRYAAGVVLILGLGIGPAAAMLSIVQRVLLQPLDYASPDRLGLVRIDIGQVRNHPGLSLGEIQDLRKTDGLFDAVEGEGRMSQMSFGPPDALEPVSADTITPGLLSMLGVSPAVGHGFTEADAKSDSPQVVLLDHGFWQAHFGADRDIVGRRVLLNGRPATVAGVLPAGFTLVTGRAVPQPIDVYLPLQVTDFRNFWGYPTLVRLAPGASFGQVNEALQALATALAKKYPEAYSADARLRFVVWPLKDDMLRATRPALNAAVAGVLLLLLIAFANATALIVARLKTRERDFAVRIAVGAGRATLVSDVLMESMVLAACGAVAGAGLAAGGIQAARLLIPHTVPRWDHIALGGNLIAMSAALAFAGLLLSGLIPAWAVSRRLPWQALRTGSVQGSRPERAASRLLLVGAQVALTVVLAFGAVQLVRSAGRLARVELGFTPDVLTFVAPLDRRKYRTAADEALLYEHLQNRLREIPGVEAAAASSHLPLSGSFLTDAWTADLTKEPGWDQALANYYAVTPGYFSALRIPVIQGRDFTDVENRTGQHVVVVDELLARAAFPGVRDVTGRVLRLGWGIPDSRIVGVVGHVRGIEIRGISRPQIYAPFGTFTWTPLNFTVRASGDPSRLAGAIRSAVAEMHTGRAVSDFAMLSDNVAVATSTLRAVTDLVMLLAISAGVLSAAGLYTVIVFILHQRRRATAIRSALGASPGQLVRLHLRTSGVVILAALPVGLALAAGVAPLFSTIIYGVRDRDPASLALAVGIAAAAGIVGIAVPVRRAASVDPVVVLRGE